MANETIEVRLTIDGTVFTTDGSAVVVGTEQKVWFHPYTGLQLNATLSSYYRSFLLEYRHSLKIEARKTTAAGASNLVCHINWAKW